MAKQLEKQAPKAKTDEALPDAALDQVSGGTGTMTTLSNVSKTRSEISMTFARNSRA
jgi:hypothetical protein